MRLKSSRLALVALPALLGLLFSSVAVAQEQETGQNGGVPPLPIVYDGEVYVDGEPLQEEAELTAMIDDWESAPAPVQAGQFETLIVGPPSAAYVGKEITFHLQGMVASQRPTFSLLTEPSFDVLRLDFSRPGAEEQPTPSATPDQPAEEPTPEPVATPIGPVLAESDLSIPWVAFGVLLAGGAVLVVALNLLARRWLRPGR